MRIFFGLCAVAILGGTGSVDAQVLTGAPGSLGGLFGGHRPVDPDRTSQQLAATLDLSGGYDDNLLGLSLDDPSQSAVAGTAELSVRYWRGRTRRNVELGARGFVNHQTIAERPLVGGDAQILGATSLGRPHQLVGGVLVSYEPTFIAGPLTADPVATTPELVVDVTPPQGVVDQRWLAVTGFGNLVRTWTRRHSTTIDARTSERRPLDGTGYDSSTNGVTVQHTWNIRPTAGVIASYRLNNNQQVLDSSSLPSMRSQTVDAGVRLQRRFSPVRTLSFTGSAGAVFTDRAASDDVAALDFTAPFFAGAVSMGLTRVWILSADATRDVSVLEGLTPEPFTTDAGTLRLEAVPSRRLRIGVWGSLSRGQGIDTNASSYDAIAAQAQVQYGFSPRLGGFLSYGYYNHRMRQVPDLAVGFPQQYDRHSVRVGVTMFLPLYGTF